jgi:Tol biopolymer transport system component
LLGDSGSAFSPDGRILAFTRTVDAGSGDLYLLALSDGVKPLGAPKRLTFGKPTAINPTWAADGHEVIFADWRGSNLWRVAAGTTRDDRTTHDR